MQQPCPRCTELAASAKKKAAALRTVWQGALRHRSLKEGGVCPLCQEALTADHIAYRFKWLHNAIKPLREPLQEPTMYQVLAP